MMPSRMHQYSLGTGSQEMQKQGSLRARHPGCLRYIAYGAGSPEIQSAFPLFVFDTFLCSTRFFSFKKSLVLLGRNSWSCITWSSWQVKVDIDPSLQEGSHRTKCPVLFFFSFPNMLDELGMISCSH